MTNKERQLLKDLSLQRLSYEDFISTYPVNIDDHYILNEVEKVIIEEDNDLLEYLISLFYKKGFIPDLCSHFCNILKGDWHVHHQEIARIFQFKLKCLCSINALEYAINQKYHYLVQSGDFISFVEKCMYAIADLNEPISEKKLLQFTASNDQIIKESAKFQLNRIAQKRLIN